VKAVLPLIVQLVTVGATTPLCYWLCRDVFGWGLHLSAALTAAIAMIAGLVAALICWKRGQQRK
jgi:Na+-driven multidrug efflux pump